MDESEVVRLERGRQRPGSGKSDCDLERASSAEMEVAPPHFPDLRSPTDMSHFDDPTVDPGFLIEPDYDYSTNSWDQDF